MPVADSTDGRHRRNLSYGQFLGRSVTIAVLAGISLFLIPLVALIAAGVMIAAVSNSGDTDTTDQLASTESIGGDDNADDWILVVSVDGPILVDGGGNGPFGGQVAGGEDIKETLRDAAADDRVKAVVLSLNTPGGSVAGSAAIADGVKEVQAAGKPVIAHVVEISASGGVWSMAPADLIVANPGSLIGSIGVIFGPISTYRDVVAIDGGLLAGGVETTGGIEQFYITAGRSKDVGNPFRELTADERASLQAIVDRLYDQFVTQIATFRPVTESDIRGQLGAEIFEANQAVEAGLADQVGTRDDAWTEAAKAAGLSRYDVRQITRTSGLVESLLFGFSKDETPSADLSGLCGSTPRALAFHGELTQFCASAD